MAVGRLFLLFFGFALLEVVTISAVAGLVGWPVTLIALLATGLVGSLLFKRQGMATWARFNQRLEAGQMPGKEVVEGALLLVGSVCLITPGFITDSIGFALLIPASRRRLAGWLIAKGRFPGFAQFSGTAGAGFQGGFYQQTGFQTGNVYEGEASVEPHAANDLTPPAASIHQLHPDDNG